jgi:hypothetical protein
MLLFVRGIAAAWLILAVLVVGVRWLGQQIGAETFPLPAANGCWQELCFFNMEVRAVPDALNAQPGVVDGSARFANGLYGQGGLLVEFAYMPPGNAPRHVLLSLTAESYDLARDWRRMDGPSLLRLGDVIQVLGAPDYVQLGGDALVLAYAARGLQIVAAPSGMGMTWARLAPSTPVTSLFVVDQQAVRAWETRHIYPPVKAWQGFGLYRYDVEW